MQSPSNSNTPSVYSGRVEPPPPAPEPKPEQIARPRSQEECSFRLLDWVLLVLLIILYVPLSFWGGSKHWAGSADTLPFIMLGLGAVYIIIESVRLYSPGVVPVLAALVPLLTIGPSLFVFPEDFSESSAAVSVGYLFGLLCSTICWFIRSKKVSPLSEWAFWMGVHSLFLAILAVPAVVCGHIALHRLPPDDYYGRTRASKGMTIGYVVLVICAVCLVVIAIRA